MVLSAFVAARKQDDYDFASPYKIDSVARPVVDPQLGHTLTYRFAVARIAKRQPPHAREDAILRPFITQSLEPTSKRDRLSNLDLHRMYLLGYTMSSLAVFRQARRYCPFNALATALIHSADLAQSIAVQAHVVS